MMSMEEDPVPLDACALPGSIKITDRALKRAEQLQAAIPSGWIVAFSWYDGSKVKADKDAPWIDQGPGIDLGGYRVGQVPEEAIWQTGSLRYAVVIWKHVIDRYPEKTIALDERGQPFLA